VDPGSVQLGLDKYFKPELFENDNKYFCKSCEVSVEKATKILKLKSLPIYLMISISRFVFRGGKLVKLMSQIKIELEVRI
jgi:ubiquitin C-terminal hydrolase